MFEVNLTNTGESDEEDDVADDGPSGPSRRLSTGASSRRREITYAFFVDSVWGRITTVEQRAAFRPELGAFHKS